MGLGGWDKDDKAERLLKSPPWAELLGVYDGASVSESLQELYMGDPVEEETEYQGFALE